MIKISVIVPVYNVENYLERCLDSLVNQTLDEIEIIVVDDGATDGSGEIISRYALAHSRLKVYQKVNGGLSDARNYGLAKATGEYVGFVDADDFVDPDMYELMYADAIHNESQVVECNLRHTFEDGTEDIEIGEEILDIHRMIMYGRSVVWNKIYHRKWLLDTNIIFQKGLIYEDVAFYVMLAPHINKISYIKAASIHYVQRSSSINNFSTLKTLDILEILDRVLSYYKEQDFYKEYEKDLEFLTSRIILCSSFQRMSRIKNSKDRKQALKANWLFLTNRFPNWKHNPTLKQDRSSKALFMKLVNRYTYPIFALVFSSRNLFKK